MPDSTYTFVRPIVCIVKGLLQALHSKLGFASLSVAFAALLLTSLIVVPSNPAQTELASVSGRVTDASGAIIVDAEIEIRSVDTGLSATRKTNSDGLYLIPSLHPGLYVINVRKSGFQSVSVTEFTLNVQDNVVRNFSLQVGSIAETVTVRANDLHINTTDAAVGTVVDRNFAENLPLNGRSFQTLIQLTPGVVLTASNGFDNTGQFSVNGQRASSNYWTVDGVSANAGISAGNAGNGLGGALESFNVLGGTNSLVSVDALQEFRIQTSTFAPEFGRTPGAQISIVTRSGANQFHGTAFDYLRNDVLDASDWFAHSKGLPKPRERQNDFGGTLGGPIFKDRTFFFFSYEGLRLRLPQVALTNVPDLQARQTATTALQPFLNAYPQPNGADNTATGVAQFNASFSNPATLDAYSLRIDHALSNGVNLFGRYSYSPSKLEQRGIITSSLSTVLPSKVTTQAGTLGLTWSLNPHTANEFRFNYALADSSSSAFLDGFGGAVPLSTLPLPSPFTAGNARLGFIILSLGTSGRALLDGNVARNEQRQINIVDSLSVQVGSHNLKLGFDFRRLSPETGIAQYSQTPLFASVASAKSGSALRTNLQSTRPADLLFRNLSVFAQDTWRVNSRLGVTYGVRWDVDFVPVSTEGPSPEAVTGFNLSDLSQLALAPTGTPAYETTYRNVAPRIGLAYQLSQAKNWQTVARGGFGVFYDLASSEEGNNLGGFAAYPFGAFGIATGGFPLSSASAAPPAIVPPNANNGQFVFAFNPRLQLPYALQWNFALEQELGSQQTLTATYVGSAGRRLLQTADIFSPNPNLAGAVLVTNTATSDYNALQLQFQRRLSRGLQGLASYTWSHSIDTASAGSIQGNSPLAGADSTGNRGSSDFDVRHNFSAALSYDLPAPKTGTPADHVLRGWSVQSIVQAQSASPVTPFYGSFFTLSNGFVAVVRPDVVAGRPFYLFGSEFPGGKALNPAAFISPPLNAAGQPIRQGNFGRNALRGFGDAQWNFAAHRDFPIHENLKIQFRAEMFNILNHPNFGQPIADLGSPTVPNGQFGLSSQMLGRSLAGPLGLGGFNSLYQIGGPRSIQFALKLNF